MASLPLQNWRAAHCSNVIACACAPHCCVVAPHRYQGRQATYDDFIGRMYNITRSTNLNYNDCDWAAYNCSVRRLQAWIP